MTKYDLYFYSFLAGTVLILIGAMYQVQHHAGAGDILATGLLFSLYWYIMGIAGIFRHERLTAGERVRWLAAFLLFSWFAGLLWYLREISPRRTTDKKDRANKE